MVGNKRVAFKQSLMPVIWNIKYDTLLATGTPCGTHGSSKKYMKLTNNDTQNANTVPLYAVEAT